MSDFLMGLWLGVSGATLLFEIFLKKAYVSLSYLLEGVKLGVGAGWSLKLLKSS